jgi:broad specificity phosphatase PhoE
VLTIVRHGRTRANADGLLLGRADPVLDELGATQARALAGALGPTGDGPAPRIVSSPLQRARQTAAAIADRYGVEVEIDDRWIELDYGELDGRPLAEVPADLWDRWREDAGYVPAGGESLRALRRRVEEATEEWLAGGEPTIVVTHVSPIKAALGWALAAGDQVNWRAFVQPASISRIDRGLAGPVLRSFNEVAHLST